MSDGVEGFWNREARRRTRLRRRPSARWMRVAFALVVAAVTGFAVIGLVLWMLVPHNSTASAVESVAAYAAGGFAAVTVYTVIADGPRAFAHLLRPGRR